MAVTGMNWCDFVVWTPENISVECIVFDDHLWKACILPKLQKFYFRFMLPELLDPMYQEEIVERNSDLSL